ncbi:archaetidylserine decarboxylase [Alteraurantiacibacter aestuarii]|uniref:phosphatidylserine decarboxylase n=1 Tax=Alteraurantiacibacter aestuarii TaxID=650004 RepID=A0A844ZKF6_9SPHN|nr:archaetidylserine decarboxylase [Alteraurantiacibacter aestuarii]MXO88044.1 phosphatidylserine decarboxylase [Alteraurantiacibacter aestuarii]
MSLRSAIKRLTAQEDLNFLLTNCIPRHAATRFMGWFSKREHPLVRLPSIALWQLFCDVDLTHAEKARFSSLHDAFTRRLKPGARAFVDDPAVLASPCDAIVGATGTVTAGQAHQIKGFDYELAELLGDAALASEFEGGQFVTLRLTAGMYHRFHAPADLVVEQVRYISGDTWNVNPVALKRVERLYCRNERAPISVRLAGRLAGPLAAGDRLLLVPVAAILVASIRLPFLDPIRNVRDSVAGVWQGAFAFSRGQEMGWFEHGSTIVVFAPPHYRLADGIIEGAVIEAGYALMTSTGKD